MDEDYLNTINTGSTLSKHYESWFNFGDLFVSSRVTLKNVQLFNILVGQPCIRKRGMRN
jgi:hypothetical protein